MDSTKVNKAGDAPQVKKFTQYGAADRAGRKDPLIDSAGLSLAVLPDICNTGIAVRILLAMWLALMLTCLVASDSFAGFLMVLLERSAVAAPAILLTMVGACGLRGLLAAEQKWLQWLALASLAACVAVLCDLTVALVVGQPRSGWQLTSSGLIAACCACGVLQVLRWRAQSRGPALVAARLAALSAHIRPHFFFNALNAVLGVIRSNPRVAETMLEDLSDLFRSLIKGQAIVTLEEETQLARKYLAIEALRLGPRLQLDWQQQDGLGDCLVPQLLLQPLVENAVRHGIEPAQTLAPLQILIRQSGRQLVVVIKNQLPRQAAAPGQQMALANIRERLMLLFDLEASLRSSIKDNVYRVELRLPLQRAPATASGSVA